ncbi:MAG TPA: BrnT family toxin [Bryobacteraceae bacterium]|nr:BrnT family toxin [Bryobacteraceae bacterium]
MQMFEWDRSNMRKIRAHRISREEAEQALVNDAIPIYAQDLAGEQRFVYYGETDDGRLLAAIITERNGKLLVVTAYDLDAGQKRDYLTRRLRGE